MALVFGMVNAFIWPVVKLLALPLIILTLGLFTLVVNGLLLWLTSALSDSLGLGFHVSGFWAAVFGSLVVSIVSTVIWIFLARESMRQAGTGEIAKAVLGYALVIIGLVAGNFAHALIGPCSKQKKLHPAALRNQDQTRL